MKVESVSCNNFNRAWPQAPRNLRAIYSIFLFLLFTWPMTGNPLAMLPHIGQGHCRRTGEYYWAFLDGDFHCDEWQTRICKLGETTIVDQKQFIPTSVSNLTYLVEIQNGWMFKLSLILADSITIDIWVESKTYLFRFFVHKRNES